MLRTLRHIPGAKLFLHNKRLSMRKAMWRLEHRRRLDKEPGDATDSPSEDEDGRLLDPVDQTYYSKSNLIIFWVQPPMPLFWTSDDLPLVSMPEWIYDLHSCFLAYMMPKITLRGNTSFRSLKSAWCLGNNTSQSPSVDRP